MVTSEELRKMSTEELHKLSLQKDEKGRYTWDADKAYEERKRRSGGIHYSNVATNCSKYQADYDYSGWGEYGNR